MGESGGPQPEQNEITEGASTTPEPESKPRRSNEFWSAIVAVVGIVATLVGAVIGGLITYQTSDRQLRAAANQAALQFNKEQRIAAYADYITSVTNLGNDEFILAQDFAQFPPVTIELIRSDYSH
jgi:hypothetical protein